MFNIRDTKNSGLFRKILNRTIPPERLANMTSEELASKELAEWREREEKKVMMIHPLWELLTKPLSLNHKRKLNVLLFAEEREKECGAELKDVFSFEMDK